MPLYRLLQNCAFDQPQIEAMAYAFESVCQERRLRHVKDDKVRELVAQKVIEFAQRGVKDPQRLRDVVASAIKL